MRLFGAAERILRGMGYDDLLGGLSNESREISEFSDYQNELLYGKKKNNSSPLERGEDEVVLIGGDLNIEVVDSEKSQSPIPLSIKSSGFSIKDIVLTTVAGLGLLGGGVGIGTAINNNPVVENIIPSVESEEQDLDTIGVLEPDR